MLLKKKTEEKLADIEFVIHKFTDKPKPNPDKVTIVSCFSEFGCEVIGAMYCIPRIKADCSEDAYIIAMGWYGRAYLYKHLVDEFWETKEDCQWLRDYSLAFHHRSKNLQRVERAVAKNGKVITADVIGRIVVGNQCPECDHFWGQTQDVSCPKCGNKKIIRALFSDIKKWRPTAVPIPKPSQEKLDYVKQYLGKRPVGVVARNRSTYGRNLQPEFYLKLIQLLKELKYDPIWIGEKQSTLACPDPSIIDFSRMPESRDLELTLAIVSQCKFTIQFWTASTRLAAILGVPYIVFESPDQLFGQGQEAYRLALCTTGKAKIVLSHYLKVYNDHFASMMLVEKVIKEMEKGNWKLEMGLIDEPGVVYNAVQQNYHRLGGII